MKFLVAFALLALPLAAERHGNPTAWMEYPRVAAIARVQGDVILNVTIDRDGKIQDIILISGPTILAEDAKRMMGTWRFNPAASSEPETATLTFKYEFRLDQDSEGTRVEFKPMTNTVRLTTAAIR